jgi:hypothetical protein
VRRNPPLDRKARDSLADDEHADHSKVLIRLRIEMWTALQLFDGDNLAGLLALIKDLNTVAKIIEEDLYVSKEETTGIAKA